MVSHFPTPTPSRTSSHDETNGQFPITMRTWIGAIILLPLVGMILGAITTGIGASIVEVYGQISKRGFGDLLELLTNVILSLINVLAVAASAFQAGALIGLYAGGACAIVVMLLALFQRRLLSTLRPVVIAGLVVAAGMGAGYGAITTAAAGALTLAAFTVGGMLFGLLAAQSILPRASRAVPRSNRSSDFGAGEVVDEGNAKRLPVVNILVGVLLGIALLVTTVIFVSQRSGQPSALPEVHSMSFPLTGVAIEAANAGDLIELANIEVGGIIDAVYSVDGTILAVASAKGVQIFDSATLTLVSTIASGVSRRIALTPDGTMVATISGQEAKLWRLADGELVRTLSGHKLGIEDLAFSPDGRLLATASLDRTARLWRLSTGESLFTLPHVGLVHSVAFRSDSALLLTGSTMGTTLWQASTGTRITLMDIVFATVHAVSFDPAGQRLAAVMSSGNLRIWNSGSQLRLHNLSVQDALFDLDFSPDGSLLAAGGADRQVHLWQVAEGVDSGTLTGHEGIVTSVDFHPAGHLLATAASDGTLRIWGMASNRPQEVIAEDEESMPSGTDPVIPVTTTTSTTPSDTALVSTPTSIIITSLFSMPIVAGNADEVTEQLAIERSDITNMAYSPDGHWLAVATTDNVLMLNGETRIEASAIKTVATRVAISPDSRILATIDGEVASLWSLPTGMLLHRLEIHSGEVMDLAFSPDSKLLATAALDRRARLWKVEDGALLHQFSHFGAVHSVAFSPDGDQLVAGTTVGMTIWRISDGTRLRVLALTSHVANRMVYRPDSTALAAAMSNGDIWFWDLVNGGRAVSLVGHVGPVHIVAFSPSGDILTSGGDDGTVHLWRAEDGASLSVLLGHDAPVTALAFHPNGTHLLSSAEDGTIRLWAIADVK